MKNPVVVVTADASGAAAAGISGYLVVIVDLIDMSTTLESALEAGALEVYGASPVSASPPVRVDPEQVGYKAGRRAGDLDSEVVIVAEPRLGSDDEREKNAEPVLNGLARSGARIRDIVPNIGKEVPKLVNFKNSVVIAVSESGGVAFDAAFTTGATVLTATVARTFASKGKESARRGSLRVVECARLLKKPGIALVAASSNSWEDVLAANYLMETVYSRLLI